MKKGSFFRAILWLLVFPLMLACSGEKEEGRSKRIGADIGKEHPEMDTLEDPKAFVLPTPTQIPTLLNHTNATYHPQVLLSLDSLGPPGSKKERAERVGGLLIDAAYCGINNDPSRVKQYAKRIRKHGNALYMSSLIENGRIQKLRELADDKKAFSEELLSFYRDIHREFREERKKELGFYMIRGAFIEGLYLSVFVGDRIPKITWKKVIEQQSLYMKNLRELRRILFRGKKTSSEVWDLLQKSLKSKKEGGSSVSKPKVMKLRKKVFYRESG